MSKGETHEPPVTLASMNSANSHLALNLMFWATVVTLVVLGETLVSFRSSDLAIDLNDGRKSGMDKAQIIVDLSNSQTLSTNRSLELLFQVRILCTNKSLYMKDTPVFF